MCQAVLYVGTVIEIKTKNSPYFHGAYCVVIGPSSTFQGHGCSVSAQLSTSSKNQHTAKKMHVMCSYKSPIQGFLGILD